MPFLWPNLEIPIKYERLLWRFSKGSDSGSEITKWFISCYSEELNYLFEMFVFSYIPQATLVSKFLVK